LGGRGGCGWSLGLAEVGSCTALMRVRAWPPDAPDAWLAITAAEQRRQVAVCACAAAASARSVIVIGAAVVLAAASTGSDRFVFFFCRRPGVVLVAAVAAAYVFFPAPGGDAATVEVRSMMAPRPRRGRAAATGPPLGAAAPLRPSRKIGESANERRFAKSASTTNRAPLMVADGAAARAQPRPAAAPPTPPQKTAPQSAGKRGLHNLCWTVAPWQ
jgi:hypothetical protein